MVPWQHMGGRPVQMYKVKNYSWAAKSSTSTWFSLPWLSSILGLWQLRTVNGQHERDLPVCGTGMAEVRGMDRTATTRICFLSIAELLFCNTALLYSASNTWSWKLIILTIPHPHKCRCTIHTDTKGMYIFSCRGNMVFMLYKMNKEKRKPRIPGYCPNHTALKSAVHWKKPTQQKNPTLPSKKSV